MVLTSCLPIYDKDMVRLYRYAFESLDKPHFLTAYWTLSGIIALFVFKCSYFSVAKYLCLFHLRVQIFLTTSNFFGRGQIFLAVVK